MKLKYLVLYTTAILCLQAIAQKPVDFSTFNSKKIDSDRSVVWTQFGPGGSGNNYYIYWHPTDPNTVFQGPNMGNAYRSTDRGETYEGILDCDGPGQRTGERGPMEIVSPDFSRQDPNFGICTIENSNTVFTTHNKGLTWQKQDKVTAQFGTTHINTIVVDPTNDNIWYAGSGNLRNCNQFVFGHEFPHGIFGNKHAIQTKYGRKAEHEAAKNMYSAKIWKSTNKGQNWHEITPKGINADAQITRLLVHPAQPNIIFAPTTYGFYKSTDGGKSWALKVKTGLDNDIIRDMDMYFDTQTKTVTLFAIDLVKYIPDGKSIKFNGGIFKSTDEGESWKNSNNNMPLGKSLMGSSDIKKSYYKLALAQWFGVSSAEVEKLYPEIPESMLHSVSMIRVNPKDVNKLLVVNNYKSQYTFYGGMLWRSDNGGENWFVTLRNGKNWETKDKASWKARKNPTSHNADWVGQDEWESRDPYDRKAGACIEFNCDGSLIMFQVAKVVCVSKDNGDTWLENDEKPTEPNGKNWVGAGNSNMPGEGVYQDVRIKEHRYFCSGENTIWKTTNDGENVRKDAQAVYKISMPNKIHPEECSVGAMAFDPNDAQTFYAVQFRQAFFGKLMKSTNSGETWTEQGTLFDPKSYGNPVGMSIHQTNLLVDPVYTSRFYCTITKKQINDVVNCNPGKFDAFGIYRSMNNGVNFDLINEGLPSKPDVQKLAFDPNNKGVVLAAVLGTSNKPGGLFQLKDSSSKWIKMTIPEGMISVHDIYFAQDKRLYISGGTSEGKDKEGGIWYTEDMKIWKQIFPFKITNHIRVAKYDANVLLVSVPAGKGSEVLNPGIYRSLNKGKTWVKVNFGNLQSDRLNDIDIDYFNRGIYWCSTYGAGYFKGIDKSLTENK